MKIEKILECTKFNSEIDLENCLKSTIGLKVENLKTVYNHLKEVDSLNLCWGIDCDGFDYEIWGDVGENTPFTIVLNSDYIIVDTFLD